ncbi:MAG: hypothetical protein R2691_06565 [Solirubrobacterales bacterium]
MLATEKVARRSLTAEDQKRLVEEALGEVDFSALAGDEASGQRGELMPGSAAGSRQQAAWRRGPAEGGLLPAARCLLQAASERSE